MACRPAPDGHTLMRKPPPTFSAYGHQLSRTPQQSGKPQIMPSSSNAFRFTELHRSKFLHHRRGSSSSICDTPPAGTISGSHCAQHVSHVLRTSTGLIADTVVSTAAPSRAKAPELTALQQEDWPGFVAFFRGASSYVQVKPSCCAPIPKPQDEPYCI